LNEARIKGSPTRSFLGTREMKFIDDRTFMISEASWDHIYLICCKERSSWRVEQIRKLFVAPQHAGV